MKIIKSLKILLNNLFATTLLSYEELVYLVKTGVIDAPIKNINGTSIDVTLHHLVRKESFGAALPTVRLYKGESIQTDRVDITNSEYIMMPDSVLLASTNETFNMPLWLSAEFSLKSTLGRNNLAHQLAGWIDPGFNGKITLELKNENQFHKLAIAPGMKIGQVKFFRHKAVPVEFSYKKQGQYNGQKEVTEAGSLK